VKIASCPVSRAPYPVFPVAQLGARDFAASAVQQS